MEFRYSLPEQVWDVVWGKRVPDSMIMSIHQVLGYYENGGLMGS